MTLLNFLNNLFLFHTNTERTIQVRIVKRDVQGITIKEKYIDIVSMFNPSKGPIGINIDFEDVENQPWMEM